MRPLDRFLEALRACGADQYRADPKRLDVWQAYCPGCASHMLDVRRLTVRETRSGGVTFSCSTGCTRESILVALEVAERLYPTSPAGRLAAAAIELAAAELDRLREARRLVRVIQEEVGHVAA